MGATVVTRRRTGEYQATNGRNGGAGCNAAKGLCTALTIWTAVAFVFCKVGLSYEEQTNTN